MPPSTRINRAKEDALTLVTRSLEVIHRAVSGGPVPQFSNAIALVLGLSENLEREDKEHDKAIRDLVARAGEVVISIANRLGMAKKGLPKNAQENLNKLESTLEDIADLVEQRKTRPKGLSRLFRGEMEADMIRDYDQRLSDAVGMFGLESVIDLQTAVMRIEAQLQEHAKEKEEFARQAIEQARHNDMAFLRDALPHANASWDPTRTCLEDTRSSIIRRITNWATSEDNVPNVFWLSGMAGCGKTTIAHSVAKALYQKGLVSCVFLRRDISRLSNPQLLFSTLARDLATHDPDICRNIMEALKDDETLGRATIALQFSELIAKPLSNSPTPTKPLIVLWDAMDECQDPETWDTFLRIIRDGLSALSHALRFVITSRPLPDIQTLMDYIPAVQHHLEPSTDNTEEDLRRYLLHELKDIAFWRRLPKDWPGDEAVTSLVTHAAGLFIWAATVLRFLKLSINPEDQLEQFCEAPVVGAEDALDNLYQIAISVPDLLYFPKAFQLVVGAVVVLQDPLTAAALSQLIDYKDCHVVIEQLGSVLSAPVADKPIQVLHQSFVDFLTNPTRCTATNFFIDAHKQHTRLAHRCFKIMHKLLRYDICNIGNTCYLNDEIHDLTYRLQQQVPSALQYASFHFASHVQIQSISIYSELLPAVKQFLVEDVLFWLEVMSLYKQVSLTFHSLRSLNRSLNYHTVDLAVIEASDDALQFAERSAYILNSCASHIYLSALAFIPHNTDFYNRLSSKFCKSIKIVQGTQEQWDPCLKCFPHLPIHSVALSPGGGHVAIGSLNNVFVLDTETGQYSLAHLEGHTRPVISVAFSPDGQYIVSGSMDNTLCVWDAKTGDPVLPPLQGHKDYVTSVAFSPNGSLIISGSRDKTIHVWDAGTGQLSLPPLQGHTGSVSSVAFSPDGHRIVSGSSDRTIRVWDITATETVLISPNEQHVPRSLPNIESVLVWVAEEERIWSLVDLSTLMSEMDSVSSVAFSPNGHHIISGSRDSTVRIWDAETGQSSIAPLEGHSASVTCVAFSPDGHHIASGSKDKTVRIWDAGTGQPTLAPFEGHSDTVCSVAFSPDSRRVVSGSWDATICVWDTHRKHAFQPALECHTDKVDAIIFSHNGCHIISGSGDSSIYVWDAATGHRILPPLKGHLETSNVECLAVSRDGQYIASGSHDLTVCVWDATTGLPYLPPLEGHSGGVRSVAFSPNGKYIASASFDKTVRVWDATTGRLCFPPLEHSHFVTSVAFSPDGCQIVSGSIDKTIGVWDAKTGMPSLAPLQHSNGVSAVAFSPNGCQIASGELHGAVCVWDAKTGHLSLPPLMGHSTEVNNVMFSHEGRYILSFVKQRDAQYVHVWDAETGELLSTTEAIQGLIASQERSDRPDALFISMDQWICSLYKGRICWIPPAHRGLVALTSDTVALGSPSGKVTIVKLY